jgi:hypothetical protein
MTNPELNATRLARARVIVALYADPNDDDLKAHIIDAITDLFHLATTEGLSPAKLVGLAEMHHEAETELLDAEVMRGPAVTTIRALNPRTRALLTEHSILLSGDRTVIPNAQVENFVHHLRRLGVNFGGDPA